MRTGFLALCIVVASQVVAPEVFVDKGACPGEGCQYGERWVAKEAVELRRGPDATSPTVGTIRSGEPVVTVTGEVHTVPNRFVVRVPSGDFTPRDEVVVYTYLGEGNFRVRHNGHLKEADLEFSPGGGSGGTRCEVESRCWGTLEREHQSTWWIQVRTEGGMEGWTAEGAKFQHPIDLAAQVAIPERRVASASRSELAIRAAKQVLVQDIDAALPRMSFDEWLRPIIGPDAPVTWESNDCGEQTGNPALDRGRDFPLCAEARVELGGGRTLRISFIVGTFAKGVSGPPAFRSASLEGRGGPVLDIATLPQVRAVARTAPLESAEFVRYPGEPSLGGKPVAPLMQLARARQFRTVLRLAAAEGPNFNGHYHVVRWGCGTSCLEWAVIDLSNGRVWFAPERSELCWAPDEPPDAFEDWPPRIEARPDSRLLYLNECSGKGSAERAIDVRRVYEWRNGAAVLLRTEPFSPQRTPPR